MKKKFGKDFFSKYKNLNKKKNRIIRIEVEEDEPKGIYVNEANQNIIYNSNPEEISFINNLAEDSFSNSLSINSFIVFKTINEILCLAYTNENKSIITYSLDNNKKINEIKNAHRYYICDLRYYLDEIHHRDLVLSISLDDNNIKVWDINNLECLLSLDNIYKKKSLITACFYRSKKQNYIITGINNDYDPIKMINLENLRTQKLLDSKDKIYFIDYYYDKNSSKNYIITSDENYVQSFDLKEKNLYHIYFDKDDFLNYKSIIIWNVDGIAQLIESGKRGYVRIWDFHSGKLLNKIKIHKNGINCLCFWNNEYLFAGCDDKKIRLVDLKNRKVIKKLIGHDNIVFNIKKIIIPKLGECLLSQGENNETIKIWRNKIDN
jgi:WD40 repeat protein